MSDKKSRKPVAQIDVDQGVVLVLSQTDTANSVMLFQGSDAQEKAAEYAQTRTASLKRKHYVFVPVQVTEPIDAPPVATRDLAAQLG
ncbi:MAG: hypothetical protein AAFU41_00715 [Pseudomonadota bacterium]